MKVFQKITIPLFFTLPLLSIAQERGEELLGWSNKKLVWADYKGKVDPESDAAAITSTYLGMNYNVSSDGSFNYKITCWFSKNKSWGKYKTDYILSHEQGHFDITEIFARKLNREMSEYKFDPHSYQQKLNKIYQDIMKEKEEMQREYDRETDFSRNKENQAEWLNKIKKMLDEYKEFADYNKN